MYPYICLTRYIKTKNFYCNFKKLEAYEPRPPSKRGVDGGKGEGGQEGKGLITLYRQILHAHLQWCEVCLKFEAKNNGLQI
jgi:hypothetical protein